MRVGLLQKQLDLLRRQAEIQKERFLLIESILSRLTSTNIVQHFRENEAQVRATFPKPLARLGSAESELLFDVRSVVPVTTYSESAPDTVESLLQLPRFETLPDSAQILAGQFDQADQQEAKSLLVLNAAATDADILLHVYSWAFNTQKMMGYPYEQVLYRPSDAMYQAALVGGKVEPDITNGYALLGLASLTYNHLCSLLTNPQSAFSTQRIRRNSRTRRVDGTVWDGYRQTMVDEGYGALSNLPMQVTAICQQGGQFAEIEVPLLTSIDEERRIVNQLVAIDDLEKQVQQQLARIFEQPDNLDRKIAQFLQRDVPKLIPQVLRANKLEPRKNRDDYKIIHDAIKERLGQPVATIERWVCEGLCLPIAIASQNQVEGKFFSRKKEPDATQMMELAQQVANDRRKHPELAPFQHIAPKLILDSFKRYVRTRRRQILTELDTNLRDELNEHVKRSILGCDDEFQYDIDAAIVTVIGAHYEVSSVELIHPEAYLAGVAEVWETSEDVADNERKLTNEITNALQAQAEQRIWAGEQSPLELSLRPAISQVARSHGQEAPQLDKLEVKFAAAVEPLAEWEQSRRDTLTAEITEVLKSQIDASILRGEDPAQHDDLRIVIATVAESHGQTPGDTQLDALEIQFAAAIQPLLEHEQTKRAEIKAQFLGLLTAYIKKFISEEIDVEAVALPLPADMNGMEFEFGEGSCWRREFDDCVLGFNVNAKLPFLRMEVDRVIGDKRYPSTDQVNEILKSAGAENDPLRPQYLKRVCALSHSSLVEAVANEIKRQTNERFDQGSVAEPKVIESLVRRELKNYTCGDGSRAMRRELFLDAVSQTMKILHADFSDEVASAERLCRRCTLKREADEVVTPEDVELFVREHVDNRERLNVEQQPARHDSAALERRVLDNVFGSQSFVAREQFRQTYDDRKSLMSPTAEEQARRERNLESFERVASTVEKNRSQIKEWFLQYVQMTLFHEKAQQLTDVLPGYLFFCNSERPIRIEAAVNTSGEPFFEVIFQLQMLAENSIQGPEWMAEGVPPAPSEMAEMHFRIEAGEWNEGHGHWDANMTYELRRPHIDPNAERQAQLEEKMIEAGYEAVYKRSSVAMAFPGLTPHEQLEVLSDVAESNGVTLDEADDYYQTHHYATRATFTGEGPRSLHAEMDEQVRASNSVRYNLPGFQDYQEYVDSLGRSPAGSNQSDYAKLEAAIVASPEIFGNSDEERVQILRWMNAVSFSFTREVLYQTSYMCSKRFDSVTARDFFTQCGRQPVHSSNTFFLNEQAELCLEASRIYRHPDGYRFEIKTVHTLHRKDVGFEYEVVEQTQHNLDQHALEETSLDLYFMPEAKYRRDLLKQDMVQAYTEGRANEATPGYIFTKAAAQRVTEVFTGEAKALEFMLDKYDDMPKRGSTKQKYAAQLRCSLAAYKDLKQEGKLTLQDHRAFVASWHNAKAALAESRQSTWSRFTRWVKRSFGFRDTNRLGEQLEKALPAHQREAYPKHPQFSATASAAVRQHMAPATTADRPEKGQVEFLIEGQVEDTGPFGEPEYTDVYHPRFTSALVAPVCTGVQMIQSLLNSYTPSEGEGNIDNELALISECRKIARDPMYWKEFDSREDKLRYSLRTHANIMGQLDDHLKGHAQLDESVDIICDEYKDIFNRDAQVGRNPVYRSAIEKIVKVKADARKLDIVDAASRDSVESDQSTAERKSPPSSPTGTSPNGTRRGSVDGQVNIAALINRGMAAANVPVGVASDQDSAASAGVTTTSVIS